MSIRKIIIRKTKAIRKKLMICALFNNKGKI